MIYIVECDFTDAARESDWNTWYSLHLKDLLAIPGFLTAQRFKVLGSGAPVYRAIYGVESLDVYTSPAYLGRRLGRFPEEWRDSITSWKRNLFSGLTRPPSVGTNECLVLSTATVPPAGVSFDTLTIAGLDRSIPEIRMGVVPETLGRHIAQQELSGVTVLQPLTSFQVSTD